MEEVDITKEKALKLAQDYLGDQWLQLTEEDIDIAVVS